MGKQVASPRRTRAAVEHSYSDRHRRRLLSGSGVAALAAGMVWAAAPTIAWADGQVTGPAGGPIAWTSGDFTITTAGVIGAAATGVSASGTLGTFSSAGQIIVTQTGVDIAPSSVVSSLGNTGLIQSGGVGMSIGSGAQVSAFSNLAGGTIQAVQAGVVNAGGTGWISNAGLIHSDSTFGVANGGDLGILQNQAGGTIRTDGAGGAAAVYNAGNINTFSNSGQILAPNAMGVIVTGGAVSQLSNESGGSISAANAAVWNNGTITSLSNGGSITSASDAAIRNFVSIGGLANWGSIGGPTAIANLGAITTLTNSGVIQAGNVAIDNPGSIQTLTNAAGGQIAANIGVQVAGSVGTLNNSGYITSASRAILIESGGSLGRINNDGVVQGYIENQSTRDLTIVGGSGSTYGTLTGYSNGGQAAILNGSSDLYLSGNLILDDTLFLGGHTVFSSGNLQLTRAVGLTGNFSQTGGSLMFAVASPTDYAQLNVSGQAQVRITGASVGLLPASSGILAQGQSYAVVQAPDGAISIQNDSVKVAGFSGTLTNTGHTLVLSLLGPAEAGATGPTGGSGGPSGATGGGGTSGGSGTSTGYTPSTSTGGGGSSGAGDAVNTLANGSSPTAQAFNSVVAPLLAGLSPAEQTRALAALGPTTVGVQLGLDAATPLAGALADQQAGYVAQARGLSYASLNNELYGGGLERPSRGLWGKVLGGGAGGDAEGGAPFSAAMVGAVVGADLVRGEELYGGLAASWAGTWASEKGLTAGTGLRLDSYQLTAYGTFAPRALGGRLAVDAVIGVGLNRYNQERSIGFLHSAAHADYDSEQYTGRLSVGYAFVGRTMTVTPYVGIDEIHLVQHGYAENGAGLADLQVKGVTADSFRHDIGVKLESAYDVGGGVRMTPSVKLGWGHTYDNGPVAVYSTLAGVPFTSLAGRPAADAALVGASLAFQSRDRISVAFEYQGDIRRDFQAHVGAVRVRWRF